MAGHNCNAFLCLVLYSFLITWTTLFDKMIRPYGEEYLEMSGVKVKAMIWLFHCDQILILVSGYLADTYMDSYSTVLIGTIISFVGVTIMTLSQFAFMQLPKSGFLILFGSIASIGRRFVATNLLCLGMEQYESPFKYRYLTKYMFILFWLRTLAVDAVKLLFHYLTTNMRHECFGEFNCSSHVFYSMIALNALMLFLLICFQQSIRRIGTCRYLFLREALYCIYYAHIQNKNVTEEERTKHWLEHAVPVYGRLFINHVKRMHIILLMLLMFFLYGQLTTIKHWDVFQQQILVTDGIKEMAEWQFNLLSFGVNLIILPIVIFISYQIGNTINMFRSELRKIEFALLMYVIIIIALAWFVTSRHNAELKSPKKSESHLRIYNPTNDLLDISLEEIGKNIKIDPQSHHQDLGYPVEDFTNVHYYYTCGKLKGEGSFVIEEMSVKSYYLGSDQIMRSFYEELEKEPGQIRFRTITYAPRKKDKITYFYANGKKEITLDPDDISQQKIPKSRQVMLHVGKRKLGQCTFHTGGVYTVIVTENEDNYSFKVIPLNLPIDIKFYAFVPLYILHCISDSIFFTYFYAFIYEQAPPPIKRFLIAIFYSLWQFSIFVYGEMISLPIDKKLITFAATAGVATGFFLIATIWFEYIDTSEDCEPDEIEYDGNLFQDGL